MKYDKEQIKEIILTDYIDGRLNEGQKREIDEAIARDPELREFYTAACKLTRGPFERLSENSPPERVWRNISEKITEARPQISVGTFGKRLLDWFRGIGARPRLSFAMGTAMAVVIVFIWAGTGYFRGPRIQFSREKQVEYLMFLAEGEISEEEDTYGGFDTTIESYFL